MGARTTAELAIELSISDNSNMAGDDDQRTDRLHDLMRELDARVIEARRLRDRLAAANAKFRNRRRNDNSDNGNSPLGAR